MNEKSSTTDFTDFGCALSWDFISMTATKCCDELREAICEICGRLIHAKGGLLNPHPSRCAVGGIDHQIHLKEYPNRLACFHLKVAH